MIEMKEADLRERLAKLADSWRAEARKHDEERVLLRLNGDEGEEYQLHYCEAQRLHRCAFYLTRALEAGIEQPILKPECSARKRQEQAIDDRDFKPIVGKAFKRAAIDDDLPF